MKKEVKKYLQGCKAATESAFFRLLCAGAIKKDVYKCKEFYGAKKAFGTYDCATIYDYGALVKVIYEYARECGRAHVEYWERV